MQRTTVFRHPLMLAVLVVSANWGFWYEAFVALLSTLAFNFFFLPPFGTFTIADPQNWIALLAFLATAVIAGYQPSVLKAIDRSTSFLTESGCRTAARSATPPPSEYPNTSVGPIPK